MVSGVRCCGPDSGGASRKLAAGTCSGDGAHLEQRQGAPGPACFLGARYFRSEGCDDCPICLCAFFLLPQEVNERLECQAVSTVDLLVTAQRPICQRYGHAHPRREVSGNSVFAQAKRERTISTSRTCPQMPSVTICAPCRHSSWNALRSRRLQKQDMRMPIGF